jgi:hypothetical protein
MLTTTINSLGGDHIGKAYLATIAEMVSTYRRRAKMKEVVKRILTLKINHPMMIRDRAVHTILIIRPA